MPQLSETICHTLTSTHTHLDSATHTLTAKVPNAHTLSQTECHTHTHSHSATHTHRHSATYTYTVPHTHTHTESMCHKWLMEYAGQCAGTDVRNNTGNSVALQHNFLSGQFLLLHEVQLLLELMRQLTFR